MSETTLGALAATGALALGDGYRTKKAELTTDGFRIIRVADVKDGRISLESPDFVSNLYATQIGAKVATPGDVLLTTKGTIGRIAIVPETAFRAVYSPQLCWFRVKKPEVINARYLSYWLQSSAFLVQSSHMQSNTDMAPYISLSDLRSSRITVPPLREQQDIAEVLGALDEKIAANHALAASADRYLASLFEELLGEAPDITNLGQLAAVNELAAKPVAGGHLRYVDIAAVGVGAFEHPDITYWDDAPGRARRALRRGDTICPPSALIADRTR